jgi:hypothetical protein
MPVIYLSAKFNQRILLNENYDFTFSRWTDEELAREREQYGHDNLGFWLKAENPNEPISPFAIPVEKSCLYVGDFNVERNAREFTFKCDAKFKVSVMKGTKLAIEQNAEFALQDLSINGEGYGFDPLIKIDLIVSTKKI